MEIGSFIELQFAKGHEYWTGNNVVRLNSGRAAIWHAFKLTECKRILLPVYQCQSVEQFLLSKGVEIAYYNIDTEFKPLVESISNDEAILIVNYFGIFSQTEMQRRAKKYKNVIIDNCPAFFAQPIENCLNVYSARKFLGVPDGSYVISDVVSESAMYPQDYSSDTSLFMLKRIEYGCEGEVYREREKNEERLDSSDAKIMSKLTHTILDSINYEEVIVKRKQNFQYAQDLFDNINLLNVGRFYNNTCVPMVYPLMVKDDTLIKRLINGKHFQGNWWKYILNLPYANDFEKELSQYMIPITIDQRYGKTELDYINSIVYDNK